jgi:sporulation protein YlmC with PRC-barrel domain/ribosomal protein L32
MKFSAIVATLVLASSTLAAPYPQYGDLSQSNKLAQVQNIKVDQDSGDIKLYVGHSWVKIGVINTGNFAFVDADQEAKQSNSKRDGGYYGDLSQSNKLAQVQNIKIDQDSGDIKLYVDHSWVKIGVLNTGNFAAVDAEQEAKQSNSKRDDKKDDDDVTQSNKALQVQNIKVDQDSGDISLYIDHSWVKIGVLNTGNFAAVDADQEAKQSNSKRDYFDDLKQSNKLAQVQNIKVDQDSGDISLYVDHSWVKIGVINTGNFAAVEAEQEASQKNDD